MRVGLFGSDKGHRELGAKSRGARAETKAEAALVNGF